MYITLYNICCNLKNIKMGVILMITIETTTKVTYKCTLSKEDEEKVLKYYEEHKNDEEFDFWYNHNDINKNAIINKIVYSFFIA